MAAELYPFIKSGAIAPPVWFDAVRLYPPGNLFRGRNPGPIVFPEDRLLARFLKRNPVMRLEDRSVDFIEKPLAVRFVMRQWELMQDGVEEEEAYARCEEHFAEEMAAFSDSLQQLESGEVMAEGSDREIIGNVEARLRELQRRRGQIVSPEDEYELQLLRHYLGQPDNLPRKHDYAVNDMIRDAGRVQWGNSTVEATLRDVLRMTEREREETDMLLGRLLEPLERLLEAAPDAAAVAKEVTVIRVVRRLLAVPLELGDESVAASPAAYMTRVLADVEEYLLAPASLAREAASLDGGAAADAAAPAAAAQSGEADPEAALEGRVDAQLLADVRAARESVRAVKASLADGYEAPDDEFNVIGLERDGETPVLIGDRSKETPIVSRPFRDTMIEVMHSAYMHAREQSNAQIKVRNKKKWRSTRKTRRSRMKMLSESPVMAHLFRRTESRFAQEAERHRSWVTEKHGAEQADAEQAEVDAEYKRVLAEVQGLRTNRALDRIFTQ